jgi:predicted cupin superfamily sugar epimerase
MADLVHSDDTKQCDSESVPGPAQEQQLQQVAAQSGCVSGLAEYYQKHLNMEAHHHGSGFYTIMHRTTMNVATPDRINGGERSVYSTIYYMVTKVRGDDTTGIGYMHRNQSDTTHYFHDGWPLKYITISPEGKYEETILGKWIDQGHKMQLTVPGKYWKAIQLVDDFTADSPMLPLPTRLSVSTGSDSTSTDTGALDQLEESRFGLLSETVGPGFDIVDCVLAKPEDIKQEHPQLFDQVKHLIHVEQHE